MGFLVVSLEYVCQLVIDIVLIIRYDHPILLVFLSVEGVQMILGHASFHWKFCIARRYEISASCTSILLLDHLGSAVGSIRIGVDADVAVSVLNHGVLLPI